GRTRGAEPHRYYYRRYDYRQWTPWELVELDIAGDYLVPAAVGGRLYLFWPIFTEIPDESGNRTAAVPNLGISGVAVQTAKKRLKLQLAVSDYRQGKWTPKRVSRDFDESGVYDVELARKQYEFVPVDRSTIDGRFGVRYSGSSLDRAGKPVAWLQGAFDVSGCQGVPESTSFANNYVPVLRPERASVGDASIEAKWLEMSFRTDAPENDFALENRYASRERGPQVVSVLTQTPGLFRFTPAWQLSYLDR